MHPIFALLVVVCSHQDPSSIPDTVAGKRLGDFITAFNTKNLDQIRSMVAANFSKQALKVLSKDEWATRIAGATEIAPISVEKVLKSSENMITVQLKSRSKTPVGIRLDLEPDIPHAIVGAKMAAPGELGESGAVSSYATWKDLDALAEMVRKDHKLPALCIGYTLGGKSPVTSCAGVRSTRDNDGIESDDRLIVGSIGKAMTATLVARMVELKRLAWDMTLENALPGYKMVDAYKSITIEQLLQHKAKLPQDLGFTQEELDKATAKAQTATDVRKVYITNLLTRDPKETPSGFVGNTNADYVVAAFIVERLIGKPYEWIMQRYVFDPMKMNTALIAPRSSSGQVGTLGATYGHMISDLGYTPYEISTPKIDAVWAPNGVCTSCSIVDLVKFANCHLQGLIGTAQVINSDSYKRLHSSANGPIDECGWQINPAFANEPCFSVSTTDGTFTTDFTIWTKSNMAIVAVTNAGVLRQPAPTQQAVMAVKSRFEPKVVEKSTGDK